MSYWLDRDQIFPIFRSLAALATFSRRGGKPRKFESRTDEGILVGYSGASKAYRVYNSAIG